MALRIVFALFISFPFILGCGGSDVLKFLIFMGLAEIQERAHRALPPYDRINGNAESYFTDPEMLAFCHALKRKDTAEMERLLRNGLDINAIGKKKKAEGNVDITLLRLAFPMGEDIFKWMLLHGADPWYRQELPKDQFTLSPADDAASLWYQNALFDVDISHYLKLILDFGPPPPPGELDRLLAEIVGSSVEKTAERVQWLVDAGADVNTTKRDLPIILEAASPSIMLILLKAGADWQVIGKDGTRGNDVVLEVARMQPFRRREPENDAERKWNQAYQELCRWLTQRGANIELAVEKLQETRSGEALKDWSIGKEWPHPPGAPQVIGNPFNPVNGNVIYPTSFPREKRTWLPPIQAPAGP